MIILKLIDNVVITLVSSFWLVSSSFFQLTRTTIKSLDEFEYQVEPTSGCS